jgi:hypothetical protein
MTIRNQIRDHQSIMNLLHENDMNTTTMFYRGEPERSETLIQDGSRGYKFQGAQILFSVTTPHSRDPNQIQTTKLSDLRTPSSSENKLGEQLLTELTRETNYSQNGITTAAWHDQAPQVKAENQRKQSRGIGVRVSPDLEELQGDLARGGRAPAPPTKRDGDLALSSCGGAEGRCSLPTSCVCVQRRGEAQLLKYPATQTHRTRSTPAPFKK